MSTKWRSLVLNNFKALHRTRLKVFHGDERALTAARQKINDEFHKNKLVKDEEAKRALLKLGEEVERELRTRVIQAQLVEPGRFEAKITADTVKVDNVMYDEAAAGGGGARGEGCCQEPAPAPAVK